MQNVKRFALFISYINLMGWILSCPSSGETTITNTSCNVPKFSSAQLGSFRAAPPELGHNRLADFYTQIKAARNDLCLLLNYHLFSVFFSHSCRHHGTFYPSNWTSVSIFQWLFFGHTNNVVSLLSSQNSSLAIKFLTKLWSLFYAKSKWLSEPEDSIFK